jgi:DNA-binding MarR family transcriptional regulator
VTRAARPGPKAASARGSSRSAVAVDSHVDVVRRFTRFFTSLVGVLGGHYLDSPFSVTEARVLYEIARGGEVAAVDLVRSLNLDAGYVSRLIDRFERKRLVRRIPAAHDGRRMLLTLTTGGQARFARLDRGAHDRVARLLAPLATADRARVVLDMQRIERLLSRVALPAPARSARRETGRSR